MRHVTKGRKLKRTVSHRKALLSNLATSLIRSEQKMIRTTLAKAKELRPFVERIITKARRAYQRERAGQLPYGKIDLHHRRFVARFIRDEAVLQELFDVIAPVVAERNGGYTRIVKLGFRRGDGAQEAIIQLVDWAAPQDGATTLKRKRRTQPKAKSAPQTASAEAATKAEPEPHTAQEGDTAVSNQTVQVEPTTTVEEISSSSGTHVEDAPVPESSQEEAATSSDQPTESTATDSDGKPSQHAE